MNPAWLTFIFTNAIIKYFYSFMGDKPTLPISSFSLNRAW